jgi:SAM-dependent methyltransferase
MTLTETQTARPQATGESAAPLDLAAVEAFAMKVAVDHAVASNAALGYLGDRLGLWRALASVQSVTSSELADRSGLAERYVREWLSAQAAAGYVRYDAKEGRFHLPAEHAAVLADDDSPAAGAGGFEFSAAVWASIDRLAHAYATGEGVGWHEHDPRLFTGVERFFRPLYRNSLVQEWLPAVDGLMERLQAGIRVLDVGCGLGTATVLLAEAFPASRFVGVDYHLESVQKATAVAARAGVQDRVRFEQVQADGIDGATYDLICFFDALHDMGDPVGALETARRFLAPGGLILAVEPAAADRLEDNLHPIGMAWYAASSLVCLPNSLSQPGRAGLGAQAGPERLHDMFSAAGLSAELVATTAYNLVFVARQ